MRRLVRSLPWPHRRSSDGGLHTLRLLTGVAVAAGLIIAAGVPSLNAQKGSPGARSRAHREAPPGIIVAPNPRLQQAPADPPAVGGVWTQLNNLPPVAVDNCLLMTDASVLCHEHAGLRWYRLTPSNTGTYQTGTWALDSTMQAGYAPLYFASAVLADGNVIVEGGEYNCASGSCTSNWGTQGSFYNASTHTWTAVNPPSVNGTPWTSIGDAQSVVLADGTFMLADCCSGKAAYFNEATLTWTPVSGHQIDNYHDEENWTLLPDRRVLTVDAWPAGSTLSEVYDPVTQQWSSAGNTPVLLTDNNRSNASYEQGPGVLRPNGTVVYFGANYGGAGHTAIYNSTTGTWTTGPDYSGSDNAADAPAALLPNGNVLSQASPGIFGTPSHWYEVDYSTGALTSVTAPSYSFAASSYYGQMLVLPTGQILQTEFSNDIRLYSPTGTYQASWQPTIASVASTLAPGSSYVISGTQFNGLSQGAAYGDDWQSATNYPIVRITNTATGHVFFARTHNHSSMGVATAGQSVSTTFDVPASIETGASTIEVVANGIPSVKTNITVQSATAPGPFSKLSPANGATGQGLSVTLSWGASANASSYAYCIDTVNNTTCDTNWISAGSATNAQVSGLSVGTTYYWLVRATNNNGSTDANAGAWWSLTTASLPGTFNKTAPANGATTQALSPTLTWGASTGAASYEYCVDTVNDDACNTSWTSVASSSAALSGLVVNTTYYWQVRAKNNVGTTDANAGTAWWSFNTQAQTVPGAFNKTSPSNNATSQASKNLTVSWGASSGAASYEYCVGTAINSCTWISTGTTRSAKVNLSGRTAYYWQVRARNTAGTTDANAAAWWTFRTK